MIDKNQSIELRLDSWIHGVESELVEFKQQWQDLDLGAGKADFIKAVLALANSAHSDQSAFLVIGIKNQLGSDRVLGVDHSPSEEQLNQILASYTQPVPSIRLHQSLVGERRMDVLEVRYDKFRRHYATRDIGNALSSSVVYLRRGPTIGIATIAAVELMIRQKSANLGPITDAEPVVSGFVEIPSVSSYPKIVGRIQNVIQEPVSVMMTWNVVWAMNPRALARPAGYIGHNLYPRETKEDECVLSQIHFCVDRKAVERGSFAGDRWFDVTWTVHFRNRDGQTAGRDHYVRLRSRFSPARTSRRSLVQLRGSAYVTSFPSWYGSARPSSTRGAGCPAFSRSATLMAETITLSGTAFSSTLSSSVHTH
jgi:hypothetical protein